MTDKEMYDGIEERDTLLRDLLLGAMARGYCSEKNSHKVLDPDLIEGMLEEAMKLDLMIRGRSLVLDEE